jgi:anion-transporting  ArsA/GET3 family ATPase
MPHVRLHFVTGKGGVGKSTVCAALARAAVREGARVLAVELPSPGGLSRILGAHPVVPGLPVQAGPNLWLSFVDGGAALSEYLGRVLRSRRLREAVLTHPLYRAFVAAAPGVGELMAIGKIRDELLQRDGFHRRYDMLVVDAGASGHALGYLRMKDAAGSTFTARGRVRREIDKIDRLLRDPEQTAVHVVALPEDMPLREAETVIAELEAAPELPVGGVFVNRCLAPAPPGFDEAIDALSDAHDVAPLVGALRWRRAGERNQQQHVARFRRDLDLPVAILPHVFRDDGRDLGVGDLDELADIVGEVCL